MCPAERQRETIMAITTIRITVNNRLSLYSELKHRNVLPAGYRSQDTNDDND